MRGLKSVGLNEAESKRPNGVVSPEVSQESETAARLEKGLAVAARGTEKKYSKLCKTRKGATRK